MEKKDVYICRREEITEEEVLKAIERGARDIDGVKRLTRAGMGLCQGKTCSVLVRNILSRELKKKKRGPGIIYSEAASKADTFKSVFEG